MRARLLVIDDEPQMGGLFVRAFRRRHDVIYESEAATALERFARGEHFDLVFCDLSMPRMSGAAFVTRMATLYPDALGRLVVITGGAIDEESRVFIDRTTRPILYKPFTLAQLDGVTAHMLGAQRA